MKKYLLITTFLFIMFIPFVVNAETCDKDKITIENLTIESKSDNVEELSDATVNGMNINLNLSMSEVGDNIEYKFVVKNDSNEDYELDKIDLNINSDYINYSLEKDDNTNIVKANSTKNIILKIQYKKEVPEDKFENGTYSDNKIMIVQLSNGETINVPDTLKNPNTGVQSYVMLFIILLLISGILYVLLKKKKYAKFMILIIGCSIIIPISVYALCKCDIKVESKIIINKKYNELYQIIQNKVDNDSIDFSKISPVNNEELNGQGVNLYDKDEYGKDSDGGDLSIYYFRGEIEDNNVVFANFCWKIIRTTSTGGTKIIYNGLYNESKKCNNTGVSTQIALDGINKFAYNSIRSNDLKYAGFTYDNNIDSNAKSKLDQWFLNNIYTYRNQLEDIGFCNERTILGDMSTVSKRLATSSNIPRPTLACLNENEDLYTLSNNSRGNKKLTYPVGLITADEISLAGGVMDKDNRRYYLNTGEDYWAMSPDIWFNNLAIVEVLSSGYYGKNYIHYEFGLRPVISLNSNVELEENGDGTIFNPYIVKNN